MIEFIYVVLRNHLSYTPTIAPLYTSQHLFHAPLHIGKVSKTHDHQQLSPSSIMKAILQRVHSASVTVDGQLISAISRGILVFAAVGQHDTKKEAETLASKVLRMRMWDGEDGAKVCLHCVQVSGNFEFNGGQRGP